MLHVPCVSLVMGVFAVVAAALLVAPVESQHVHWDCDGGGACAVNLPPPNDTVDSHDHPNARLFRRHTHHWHFDVESVLAELDHGHGRPVVLTFTELDAVRAATVAACADALDAVVFRSHAPVNPFVQAVTYFWSGLQPADTPPPPAVLLCPSLLPPPSATFTVTPLPLDGAPTSTSCAATSISSISSSSSSPPHVIHTPACRRRRDTAQYPHDDGEMLRWFVYPDPGTGPLSKTYARILDRLRNSPQATTDPSQACLLFPPFDTTPLPPFVRGSMADFGGSGAVTAARLRRLPHWNGGHDHVVLDLTDSRSRFVDAGAAYVWKSGYDHVQFRPDHDVPFPLLPLKTNTNPAVRRFNASSRPITACFKGALWSHDLGAPPFDVRLQLLQVAENDGTQFVFVPGNDTSTDYVTLLASSVFCVVPRGGGLHSYRFVEVLSFGCIPVILSDDWVVPFQNVIPPDLYAVVIPERDVASLPAVLNAIPDARRHQLHRNAIRAYERLFADPLTTALKLAGIRLTTRPRPGR